MFDQVFAVTFAVIGLVGIMMNGFIILVTLINLFKNKSENVKYLQARI